MNRSNQENSIDKQINQVTDLEYLYEDEEEGRLAQEKATLPQPKINMYAYPTRQYLDQTITQLLLDAMKALAKERPNDPIEFFAYYLLINNPYNEKLKELNAEQKQK